MTGLAPSLRPPLPRRAGVGGVVVATAVLFAAGLLGPSPRVARADEPPSPAPVAGAPGAPAPATLESLTSDEREIIRRRFPDWDRLDAATQARIVGTVVKLRTLSPELRERFLERMRRLDRAGPMTVENVAKNLPAFAGATPERRAELVRVHVVARAVTASFVAAWPTETRDALFGTGTGVLSPQERLQLAGCVSGAWRRRVIEGLVQAPPLDVEPAEGTSDVRAAELVTLRDQVRLGGGAQSDLALRRRYAGRVFDDHMLRVKSALGKRPMPTESADAASIDAHLVVWGERIRAEFPAASESIGAELLAAAAKGREGLAAFCEKSAPERPPMRERALWELLFHLESKRRDLAGDVLARTDELENAILASLRVPDERVRALRTVGFPSARARLLRQLFDEFGPQAPRAETPPKRK